MATDKQVWLLYGTLAALTTFTACTPLYYAPNAQNVPLFEGKGETTISAAGTSQSGEIQAAHAVSDHVQIQLNGAYFFENDDESDNNGNGVLGEVAAGYYQPFAERFVWGANAMLGYGQLENNFPSIQVDDANGTKTGHISANLSRWGVQPYIGFKTLPFEAVVSTRLVNLNYFNVKGQLPFENREETTYLENNSSQWHIEPAVTLRGGYKSIYLQLQWLKSFNLNDESFRFKEDHVSLGLLFYLGRGEE